MKSFRSHHYPRSGNAFLVRQEYAMQYYGVLNILLMAGLLLYLLSGSRGLSLVFWAIGGELAAIALANMFTSVRLHRTYAEIFFLKDHFSLISVNEILSGRKNEAFPLRFAQARVSGDRSQISLHFGDEIVELKREDWEDFDGIIESFLYPEPGGDQ
jgi:hypothetical protein